jgi:hypothetical protein
MSLRFGNVSVVAEHKIFSDKKDFRQEILAIDGEKQDVRDVVDIMRTRMDNFHVIQTGLRKILELIFNCEKHKKYMMGEEFDGKPKVSGDCYKVVIESIFKNLKYPAIASCGFHIFKHLANSKEEPRRLLYRDALVNCGCTQLIVEGLNVHLLEADVCLHGTYALVVLGHGAESILSEMRHFQATPILEKIKAEYLISRPKTTRLASQMLAMLASLKNNSLYQLQVEAQRLRRAAASPNASIQDKVAAAKAQAAIQLAKMTS